MQPRKTVRQIISFSKVYRWYLVLTYALIMLIPLVIALGSNKPLDITFTIIFVIICALIIGICLAPKLLPIFLIFKRLESLIRKYVADPKLNLKQQPEIHSLKRLLIFIFVMNIIYYAIPIKNTSEAEVQTLLGKIENPVIASLAKSFLTGDAFWYWYNTLTSWAYISFDGLMPLFYLVLGYCVLRIDSENKKLKEELDEVI